MLHTLKVGVAGEQKILSRNAFRDDALKMHIADGGPDPVRCGPGLAIPARKKARAPFTTTKESPSTLPPILSCPVLSCLSSPPLSSRLLPSPFLSSPPLPSLHCPALSRPVPPRPAVSCPVLSCPVPSSFFATSLCFLRRTCAFRARARACVYACLVRWLGVRNGNIHGGVHPSATWSHALSCSLS